MTLLEREIADLKFEIASLKNALAVLTCSIYRAPEDIKKLGDFCRIGEAYGRSTGVDNVARIDQPLYDKNAEIHRRSAVIFDITQAMREKINETEPEG